MENLFSVEYATMLVRFIICVAVNWFIIDRLYYAKSRRRDFFFTFMLISIAIFFLVYFMIFVLEDMKGKTSMGIGIGLFGIFYGELLATNAIVILAVWLCEQKLRVQPTKLIQYDRIELVKPERRGELIADLEARTGLKILNVEVGGMDFLRDMVVIRVAYESPTSGNKDVDNMYKLRKTDYANG